MHGKMSETNKKFQKAFNLNVGKIKSILKILWKTKKKRRFEKNCKKAKTNCRKKKYFKKMRANKKKVLKKWWETKKIV
jgi:hypothetical protein